MFSTAKHPFASATTLLSLLLVVTAHAAPPADLNASSLQRKAAQTYSGCYSSSEGLSNVGTYGYQSTGYCGDECTGNGNQAVLGLTQGNDCWCGNELPPASAKVDDSKCSTPCFGFGSVMCGGSSFWSVYLTGAAANVPQAGGSSSSAASSSAAEPTTSAAANTATSTAGATPTTSAGAAATSTEAMQTIVTSIAPGTTIVVTQPASHEATAAPSPSSGSHSGGGSNTAGIAAGVVVGVVAAAAIVGGIFFFLRRRRQQQAEEDYKRSTQVHDFMRGAGESKPPGTGYSQASDQRLDPGMGRRNSVGSMADSQDYSRRILRVANPDRS